MIRNLTNNGVRILEYFFKHPTQEKHIRGLEEETGIPYSTVRKALKELDQKNLIKKRKESKMTFYQAINNDKFQRAKKLYNLQILYEIGLVNDLEQEFRPDVLVLFGSFLEGKDKEASDIDIAIINGRDTNIKLGSYEEELNREIQLVKIEDPRREDKEFRNTLANGFVLSGYLELI